MLEELFKIINRKPDYFLQLPPPDNQRLIISRTARQIILSQDARSYISEVRNIVLGNKSIKIPTGEVCFLLYRAWFKDRRRRDAGNLKKIIEDALFDEDRNVCTWVLPALVCKEQPGVEVWLEFVPKKEIAEYYSLELA